MFINVNVYMKFGQSWGKRKCDSSGTMNFRRANVMNANKKVSKDIGCKDNDRSVRPSTSRTYEIVVRVIGIVRNNRRLTVKEVAEGVGLSNGPD